MDREDCDPVGEGEGLTAAEPAGGTEDLFWSVV